MPEPAVVPTFLLSDGKTYSQPVIRDAVRTWAIWIKPQATIRTQKTSVAK